MTQVRVPWSELPESILQEVKNARKEQARLWREYVNEEDVLEQACKYARWQGFCDCLDSLEKMLTRNYTE